MVKKNGIHFITAKSDHGQVLENSLFQWKKERMENLLEMNMLSPN